MQCYSTSESLNDDELLQYVILCVFLPSKCCNQIDNLKKCKNTPAKTQTNTPSNITYKEISKIVLNTHIVDVF